MEARPSGARSWIRSRSTLALLGFAVIAGFFLVTEHTAHVLGVLPYLLLLACPLMHFFHRGHGHGHDHPDDTTLPADEGSR